MTVNMKALITDARGMFERESSLWYEQQEHFQLHLTFRRTEQAFSSCNFAIKLWWMN